MIRTKGSIGVHTSDKRMRAVRAVGDFVLVDKGTRISTCAELTLRQPFRNHQVSTVLTDIADLQGGVVGDFALNGQVVLLRHRWLHRVVPSQHGRAGKGISSRDRACARSCLSGKWRTAGDIRGLCLRRSIRRILSETQVGPSTFEVRGDGVGSANYRFLAEWAPGKTDARLKVRPPIGRLVESSAKAIGPDSYYWSASRELQGAGEGVYIDLAVVFLPPGCARFVPQSKIQSQTIGDAPVVLHVPGIEGIQLMPGSPSTGHAVAHKLGQSQCPVSCGGRIGCAAR